MRLRGANQPFDQGQPGTFRNRSFLAALAMLHADQHLLAVDIGNFEQDDLRDMQAGVAIFITG
jgi:hypothetical protein